jgi:hypothetical protein
MEKNRFSKKKSKDYLGFVFSLPVISLLIMMLFFWQGLAQVEQVTEKEEKRSLEKAIVHSTIHSYATNGVYPENLKTIERDYGIDYNKKKYIVTYEIFADNLMPIIQVIRLK